MKDPHNIIIAPYITEKSAQMSYGDPTVKSETDLVRKYTFLVAVDSNKIEIKKAIEAIYNAGKKKKDDLVVVTSVRTLTIKGKQKRNRIKPQAKGGYTATRKKAIVTLAKGHMLEDYGV